MADSFPRDRSLGKIVANGRYSLARRHRKVIKTRIEEAEGQISQLKLKLSGSRAPGMQFNKDSPHPRLSRLRPKDPQPQDPGRLDYFRPKTRIVMRPKEGNGTDAGRGARAEGDPEEEERLASYS